jgi:hypothetical protein
LNSRSKICYIYKKKERITLSSRTLIDTVHVPVHNIKIFPSSWFGLLIGSWTHSCAGIFKQSIGARNRKEIRLSYRPVRLHNLYIYYLKISRYCPFKAKATKPARKKTAEMKKVTKEAEVGLWPRSDARNPPRRAKPRRCSLPGEDSEDRRGKAGSRTWTQSRGSACRRRKRRRPRIFGQVSFLHIQAEVRSSYGMQKNIFFWGVVFAIPTAFY